MPSLRNGKTKQLDPIKQGRQIFYHIASKWHGSNVPVPGAVDELLNQLIAQTDGLVIVDFFDTTNWDNLSGYEFDPVSRHLILHWRDFRSTDRLKQRDDEDRWSFPASLYGAFLHLQSIRILRSDNVAIFLLQGYSVTEKEARQALTTSGDQFPVVAKSAFSFTAELKKDNLYHVIECFTAPLYTVALIPKNCGRWSAEDSRGLLLFENTQLVLARLQKALTQIQAVDVEDTETICNLANGVRRNIECSLKIECAYRNMVFPKAYPQMLLGDLMGMLRPYHDDAMKEDFSKIAEWANQFSHDSGKPIEKNKAEALSLLGIRYVEILLRDT